VDALGAVVETDRGSLPFALLHGEALVACAAWALGEAGVQLVDLGTSWAAVTDADVPFVLHDPLCPMTPPEFLLQCVTHAAEQSAVTVGVHPVREVHSGDVGGAGDRSGPLQVVSPIVLPAAVVAALDGLPTTDFAALVADLSQRFPVETLGAPAEARRIATEADLPGLEELTRGAE
jgi:2-C-methyl-D-erythritol 4-phosphate cytidylyltransferase